MFSRRVGRHLLFWMSVLAFFSAFDFITREYSFLRTVALNLIYLPQDVILVYIILYLIIPGLYLKKRYLLFVLSILGILAINVGISFFIDIYLRGTIGPGFDEFIVAKKVQSSILVFLFIATLATTLRMISLNNRIMLNKEAAEAKFHKTELALLRSQINPHFLFNVFNNIDELIYQDRDKASETLAFLSDSLRYVLRGSGEDNVMLEEEVAFLKAYLRVAAVSFSDPMFISSEFSSDCKNMAVPPLIFIPFIENCVKHCDKRSDAPGIEIRLLCSDDSVKLYCRNSIRSDRPVDPGKAGYGLENARKRLDLIYGDQYSLNLFKEGNYFITRLEIMI